MSCGRVCRYAPCRYPRCALSPAPGRRYLAAGLAAVTALLALAGYAWLTAGAATPAERERCRHLPYHAAERGGLCFIIRRLDP